MADKKITDLPLAGAMTDDDVIVGVDSPASSPATKKWAGSTVKTYVTTSLSSPSASGDAATKGYVDTAVAAAAGASNAAARLYLWANYA